MDFEMMNYLTESINNVTAAIESIGIEHDGSMDIYKTWGQVLYQESESKVEDSDWVHVRLEMVVLNSFHYCIYLIQEECFVDEHSYISRYVVEHGQVSDRFMMIRNAAEKYTNWHQYWKSIKRTKTQEVVNG